LLIGRKATSVSESAISNEQSTILPLSSTDFRFDFHSVGEQFQREQVALDRLSIHDQFGNSLAQAFGIFHADLDGEATEISLDLESLPGFGNAGIDPKSFDLRADAENVLERTVMAPTGGS
jgi:hypothetical protein